LARWHPVKRKLSPSLLDFELVSLLVGGVHDLNRSV
jgi:hypothetical protein